MKIPTILSILALSLLLSVCAAAAETPADPATYGTQTQRGFLNDNVYHSDLGDIHYSSYIPDSYEGSEPYALFITLPGWEGLYFQGVGANMVEDFGRDQVYLEGYSGGGETGSLVMGMRPELYAAFLMVSSQWDGDLEILAAAKTPVYLATGEQDSYYGSGSMKDAYARLHELYEQQGLSDEEINKLIVLDVKDQEYFSQRGHSDQHGGGMAFAKDEEVMGWLFGQ